MLNHIEQYLDFIVCCVFCVLLHRYNTEYQNWYFVVHNAQHANVFIVVAVNIWYLLLYKNIHYSKTMQVDDLLLFKPNFYPPTHDSVAVILLLLFFLVRLQGSFDLFQCTSSIPTYLPMIPMMLLVADWMAPVTRCQVDIRSWLSNSVIHCLYYRGGRMLVTGD